MKRKIGIVTIQSENYGNRLQNYAVNEVLKKRGYVTSNIQTQSKNEKINDVIQRHPKISSRLGIFLDPCIFLKNCIEYIYNRKKRAYKIFNDNMKYSKDVVSPNFISHNIGSKYDVFIVGSDQVWNVSFPKIVSINSFLPFSHLRKIAFSASFGVDSIPYDQKIVDCLKDFKALSVREEAGAKIIKDLTGREATVLVDPTMLLTKEEWRKVSKMPRGAKEGYVLTYFLSPKCDEATAKLEEIREDKKVYELLNPNDKVAGTAGPSEFLWLFDHADLILTDSFHACVFSFLFNKPFVVYDRNWGGGNMNSRLETLLRKFHLERKYANSGLDNDIWEHDYSNGYKQLDVEREKAINFLKKALED